MLLSKPLNNRAVGQHNAAFCNRKLPGVMCVTVVLTSKNVQSSYPGTTRAKADETSEPVKIHPFGSF